MKIYDITKPKVVHDLNHHELKLVEERKVGLLLLLSRYVREKENP
jgi:hypothetical protein